MPRFLRNPTCPPKPRLQALTDGDLAIAEESALECLCGEGLRLPGFLGITDTPRPDARELLLGLAKRDIGVRVITGDRPATARAIARQIGLDVADESVITGARWERAVGRGARRGRLGHRHLRA